MEKIEELCRLKEHNILLDVSSKGNKKYPWKLMVEHAERGIIFELEIDRDKLMRLCSATDAFLERHHTERLFIS